MYCSYFGLGEAPFSIAPDPRYLYMSQRHQEALAHLLYGVNGYGGFVLLTGEVGAGKTTLCRCLLGQIPAACDIAYIFNPRLTVEELLSTICTEFGVAVAAGNASIKTLVDCINTHLLDAHARGRHTVLIIDEAQNLAADVLEQMRLLTNLETDQRKLLQIILLGQPELAQMLERPGLRQLAQRIVARYHLGPLTKSEVAAYVRHRLEVAGARRELFPPSLTRQLYRLSQGVPRVVNVLCDRALLGAYVQGKAGVDRATLAQAAREVFFQPPSRRSRFFAFFSGGAKRLREPAPAAVDEQVQVRPGTPPAPPSGAKSGNRAERAKSGVRVRAAEPPAALPETLEWPAAAPRSRSKAMAYAALFRAWGAEYPLIDLFAPAEHLALRPRTARGGLAELRQLNRPAILHLRDRKGREFDATLTALDDDAATLVVGATQRSIAVQALATQWPGQYTLLWRLPPGVRENIWPGERGPAVDWLRRQLALALGRPVVAMANAEFDEELMNEVKQYQRAQGLLPDGAVSGETLVRLSGVNDPAAPTLVRCRAEQ